MAFEKEIVINVKDKGLDQVTDNIKNLNSEIKNTDKDIKKSEDGMKSFTSVIDGATGGSISKFQGLGKTIGSVRGGFVSLKSAIIATGLGLLVVVIGSLIEYFKNFEAGVKIVTTITNLFADTISAIVSNAHKLLSLDFKGFFGGVKDAMVESVNATNDLFEAQTKLYELNKKFIVENANLNAEIESQGRIVRDTTKTFAERLEAQKKLDLLSEKLIKNEKDLNDAELIRLKTELRLENNYEKRRDLEIQIEQTMANLIGVESKLAAQRDKASKAQRQIVEEQENQEKERLAKANERAKKIQEDKRRILEKEKAEKQKEIEDSNKKEEDRKAALLRIEQSYILKLQDLDDVTNLQKIARQEQRALAELKLLEATEDEKVKMMDYYASLRKSENDKLDAEAKIKTDKENEEKAAAEKAYEETLQNMRVGIRENTTGLLLAIAKKGGAVSKAIQIAEIIREQVASGSKSLSAMTVANAKAIAASPLTGGQPFVTINTAQVLTGMALSAVGAGKAIKDILSESKNPTQFSAGGGSGGGSAPSAPSFNLVQGTGSNQIAQGLQRGQQPIKAYVVSSDVSTGQEMDRKIIVGASL
jgi:hypothetical protein